MEQLSAELQLTTGKMATRTPNPLIDDNDHNEPAYRSENVLQKTTRKTIQVEKRIEDQVRNDVESVVSGASAVATAAVGTAGMIIVDAAEALESLSGVDLNNDGIIGSAKGKAKKSGEVLLEVRQEGQALIVTVKECRGLARMDRASDNDVYVVMSAWGKSFRTPTLQNAGTECSFEKDNEVSFQIPSDSLEEGFDNEPAIPSDSLEESFDNERQATMPRNGNFQIKVYDEDFGQGQVDDVIGACGFSATGLVEQLHKQSGNQMTKWYIIREAGDLQFDLQKVFERLEEQQQLTIAPRLPLLKLIWDTTFPPKDKRRLTWDVVILILVFYSSIIGPYKTAFASGEVNIIPQNGILNVTDSSMSLQSGIKFVDESTISDEWGFDDWVDVLFWLDMLLTFFTGFDRGFEVIMDKREIAKNYLRGWFFPDFIATMQWSWVVETFVGKEAADNPNIKMLRLIKVMRLARAHRIISRVTELWTIHTAYIETFNFLLYVAAVCNLLACLFYICPKFLSCKIDQDVADAAFEAADKMAVGWYYQGTSGQCMQGSWRQVFELEEICFNDDHGLDDHGSDPDHGLDDHGFDPDYALRVCQETAEFNYKLGTLHKWSPRALSLGTPYNDTMFVASVCDKCKDGFQLWTQAFYWSLTTMTTIGYGDLSPQREEEMHFVLFAQVIGLAFFALLLTQINEINDAMTEDEDRLNNEKNQIVQFMKRHSIDPAVINESMRFLNFRHGCLSGNSFTDDDIRFAALSPGIRKMIKINMNFPMLRKVRLFGWHPIDEQEARALHTIFDKIDTAGTNHINRSELGKLFESLELWLDDEELEQCFNELDISNTGEINYHDFKVRCNRSHHVGSALRSVASSLSSSI